MKFYFLFLFFTFHFFILFFRFFFQFYFFHDVTSFFLLIRLIHLLIQFSSFLLLISFEFCFVGFEVITKIEACRVNKYDKPEGDIKILGVEVIMWWTGLPHKFGCTWVVFQYLLLWSTYITFKCYVFSLNYYIK